MMFFFILSFFTFDAFGQDYEIIHRSDSGQILEMIDAELTSYEVIYEGSRVSEIIGSDNFEYKIVYRSQHTPQCSINTFRCPCPKASSDETDIFTNPIALLIGFKQQDLYHLLKRTHRNLSSLKKIKSKKKAQRKTKTKKIKLPAKPFK